MHNHLLQVIANRYTISPCTTKAYYILAGAHCKAVPELSVGHQITHVRVVVEDQLTTILST